MIQSVSRSIASRLEQGTFTRVVAILVGGAIGAQVLNALVAPFLTRLYDPTEFGLLGLFMTFVSVSATAVCLGYDQAIVVAETNGVAARVARLAFILALPVTAVLSVALALLMATNTAGFGALPGWTVPLAAASLGGMGVTMVLRHWLIRASRFDVIASVNVIRVAARGLLQIGLGVIGLGVGGLLVGDVAGRVAGVGRMLTAARARWGEAMREPVEQSTLRIGAAYARFPLLWVPSSLVNALAIYVPIPLLAAAYGLPVAGFFSLVQRVLGAPLLVVGSSVSDAFLGRISKRARRAPERAERLFLRTALGLAALAVPMGVVITLLAPPVFELVFGDEWRLAGDLAVAMVPAFMGGLIVNPLSRVVAVYGGQLTKLMYDLVSLVVAVATLAIAADRGLDPVEAIWYLSVGWAAVYCLYFALLYRMVRRGSRTGAGQDPAR
jgi:O-antigen/teichoic acid export membrane protein